MKKRIIQIALTLGLLIFIAGSVKIVQQAQNARQNLGLPELVILSHSSFVSSTGPGPRLKQIFQRTCQCHIRLINVGSGHLLLHRLQLKTKQHTDLVIGLDSLSLTPAFQKLRWKTIDYPQQYLHPIAQNHSTPHFLPYNYSPLTFITRHTATTNRTATNEVNTNKIPTNKTTTTDGIDPTDSTSGRPTGENATTGHPTGGHPTGGHPTSGPSNWQELFAEKKSISLQNPHTSSLGLQFIFWIWGGARPSATSRVDNIDGAKPRAYATGGYATSGRDQNQYKLKNTNSKTGLYAPEASRNPNLDTEKKIMLHRWRQLNIHSLSPSWSTSYALFRTGQSDMTFSYLTSLVYHWQQKQFNYKALQFDSGHPLQIEFLAIPNNCLNCQLAKKWAYFMLSREGQKIIMQHNYMLPARAGLTKGTLFEKLPRLKTLPPQLWADFITKKDELNSLLFQNK